LRFGVGAGVAGVGVIFVNGVAVVVDVFDDGVGDDDDDDDAGRFPSPPDDVSPAFVCFDTIITRY
jgi:hypothetical protein